MYFSYQDINLHYEVYGEEKDALIILPGWGETRRTFDSFIGVLSDYYTVYYIDYPGFGKTNFPNRDLTMYDYTECILSFLKEKKINNPFLLAHSFGGRIAILLTGKYNYPVQRIILMDSAGIKPKKSLFSYLRGKLYKLLQSLTNLLPKKRRKKAKHALFKKFSSPDYYNLKEEERKTFQNIVNLDLTSYLSSISCETLLLWGEKDMDTPLRDAYIMKKEIKNSELIVFQGSHHFSYLENIYTTLKIILEFF